MPQAYQVFWWRRRDVYRLLLSLSTRVDGITWREADREPVEQMQDLIRTVTGVQSAGNASIKCISCDDDKE